MLTTPPTGRKALTLVLGLLLCAGASHAAAPLTDPLLDIRDLYVFRSPSNPTNVVFVLDIQSIFDFTGGNTGGPLFSNNGIYRIFVSNNGDVIPEFTIETRFGTDATGQVFQVSGLPTGPIGGRVTPLGAAAPIIAQSKLSFAFAGPRDDPAFFDLTGFNSFVASPYLPAAGLRQMTALPVQNFFRGNVASIVIETPIQDLTGLSNPNVGILKVWSKTFKEASAL